MHILNDTQINQISAGSGAAITGTTALCFALYFYYAQENKYGLKFQEMEKRLEKLEALANLSSSE